MGRCIQWLLGDWIAYGSSKFGEKYGRAAQITRYDAQSLMNMVYVASRFPISRRRENLSWSHHEAVAALDERDQTYWLDQALEQRWSVADLRMLLRTARREREAAGPAEAGGLAGADAASRVTVRQQNALPEAASPTPPALAGIVICPHCGKEVTVASTPTSTTV